MSLVWELPEVIRKNSSQRLLGTVGGGGNKKHVEKHSSRQRVH